MAGSTLRKQLVTDERTNLISFTGGAAGGEHITTSAGLKKVLLELGGNGATIVHHDADIEQAASLCAKTGFSNSGQSCISVQRIYVHQEIMPSFTEVLKQKVEQLVVGDPLSSESDIGCMVDVQAAQRVETWIQEAESMGAQLLCGGKRNGASITPAILLNPPKQSKVVCEEVFGPVVSILPYAEPKRQLKKQMIVDMVCRQGSLRISRMLRYTQQKSLKLAVLLSMGHQILDWIIGLMEELSEVVLEEKVRVSLLRR